MKLQKFQEQIFFSTVRITLLAGTGVGQSIGTGFLVRAPLPTIENKDVTLLISNRHVFEPSPQELALAFHKVNEDRTAPLLGTTTTLRDDQFGGPHWTHQNPDIDIACLNVPVITSPERKIYHTPLTPEQFADFQEDDLLPGNEVWFVGYPENRFDTAHNLPLLRRGYIASIPTVDFNSKKEFVIDAQVFRGSSGSPVFSVLGNQYRLIGVLTQTLIRHEQLETVPSSLAAGVEQVIGLGIVIKAPVVKELVDLAVEYVERNVEESADRGNRI